jgi:hypothetical protein
MNPHFECSLCLLWALASCQHGKNPASHRVDMVCSGITEYRFASQNSAGGAITFIDIDQAAAFNGFEICWMTLADVCARHASCGDCGGAPGCGWCDNTESCIPSSAPGACPGSALVVAPACCAECAVIETAGALELCVRVRAYMYDIVVCARESGLQREMKYCSRARPHRDVRVDGWLRLVLSICAVHVDDECRSAVPAVRIFSSHARTGALRGRDRCCWCRCRFQCGSCCCVVSWQWRVPVGFIRGGGTHKVPMRGRVQWQRLRNRLFWWGRESVLRTWTL